MLVQAVSGLRPAVAAVAPAAAGPSPRPQPVGPQCVPEIDHPEDEMCPLSGTEPAASSVNLYAGDYQDRGN